MDADAVGLARDRGRGRPPLVPPPPRHRAPSRRAGSSTTTSCRSAPTSRSSSPSRLPTRSCSCTSGSRVAARSYTELPGGMLRRRARSPANAAARELLEETGYACDELRELGRFEPDPTKIVEHDRRLPRLRRTAGRASRSGTSRRSSRSRLLPVGVATRCDPGRRDHVRRLGRDRLPRARRARASVKVAVVGHVEWVEFVEVDHVPGARADRARQRVVGGAGGRRRGRRGAAAEARRRLRLLHGARRRRPRPPLGRAAHGARARPFTSQWFGRTRRALVHVDSNRERTITTVGAEAAAGRARCRSRATTRSSSSPATSRRCARRARRGSSSATPARARDAARGRRPPRPARRQRHRSGRALRRRPRRRRRRRDRGCARRRRERRPLRSRCRRPGRSRTPTAPATRSRAALSFALARGDSLPDALELASRAGAAVDHRKGAVHGADRPVRCGQVGVVG